MDWERYSQLIGLTESGKPEAALPGLQELASSTYDPEDKAEVLFAIAACQQDIGKLQDARQTIRELRSVARKDSAIQPRAIFQDVLMKHQEGDWRGILDDLECINREYALMLTAPSNRDLAEQVVRYKGIAFYRLGQIAEAKPLLEEAAKLEYLRARTLYWLGRCCYDLGDFAKAKASLGEALKLDLELVYQPSAHYILGLAYHWSGQSAWAIPEFEWCLENDKGELVKKWMVLTALVNACKALGQQKEAERYSRILAETPRD